MRQSRLLALRRDESPKSNSIPNIISVRIVDFIGMQHPLTRLIRQRAA
jgi:hypothetical protein